MPPFIRNKMLEYLTKTGILTSRNSLCDTVAPPTKMLSSNINMTLFSIVQTFVVKSTGSSKSAEVVHRSADLMHNIPVLRIEALSTVCAHLPRDTSLGSTQKTAHVVTTHRQPSRKQTSSLCRFNVGPASATLAQP